MALNRYRRKSLRKILTFGIWTSENAKELSGRNEDLQTKLVKGQMRFYIVLLRLFNESDVITD